MNILTLIFYSIYLMIPAYLANGSALVFGGGTPMDFGHYCWDNRRLIGDGVTWRGTVWNGYWRYFRTSSNLWYWKLFF